MGNIDGFLIPCIIDCFVMIAFSKAGCFAAAYGTFGQAAFVDPFMALLYGAAAFYTSVSMIRKEFIQKLISIATLPAAVRYEFQLMFPIPVCFADSAQTTIPLMLIIPLFPAFFTDAAIPFMLFVPRFSADRADTAVPQMVFVHCQAASHAFAVFPFMDPLFAEEIHRFVPPVYAAGYSPTIYSEPRMICRIEYYMAVF